MSSQSPTGLRDNNQNIKQVVQRKIGIGAGVGQGLSHQSSNPNL